ncbi:HD domain-containing protein [Candidatus Parcubacteria bacterium]|nr:HD domain-containing protein [Candidatus Parcubacteria bacterium]
MALQGRIGPALQFGTRVQNRARARSGGNLRRGDTIFFDEEGQKSKGKRERRAAKKIFGQLPRPLREELSDCWEEFEARSSPEARLVKAFDILIAVLQNIAAGGSGWRACGVTYQKILAAKEKRIRSDFARVNKTLWGVLEDLVTEVKAKRLVRLK